MATGAVIALVVKQPLLAVPLAFASHFVLDALPHYGVPQDRRHEYRSFKRILIVDALCTIVLGITMIVLTHSWLVLGCMVAALSPDTVWGFKLLLDKQRGKKFTLPTDPFSRFHKNIQWGERHWGWIIELIWAVASIVGLSAMLTR